MFFCFPQVAEVCVGRVDDCLGFWVAIYSRAPDFNRPFFNKFFQIQRFLDARTLFSSHDVSFLGHMLLALEQPLDRFDNAMRFAER